jgi:hypothetical protein
MLAMRTMKHESNTLTLCFLCRHAPTFAIVNRGSGAMVALSHYVFRLLLSDTDRVKALVSIH